MITIIILISLLNYYYYYYYNIIITIIVIVLIIIITIIISVTVMIITIIIVSIIYICWYILVIMLLVLYPVQWDPIHIPHDSTSHENRRKSPSLQHCNSLLVNFVNLGYISTIFNSPIVIPITGSMLDPKPRNHVFLYVSIHVFIVRNYLKSQFPWFSQMCPILSPCFPPIFQQFPHVFSPNGPGQWKLCRWWRRCCREWRWPVQVFRFVLRRTERLWGF